MTIVAIEALKHREANWGKTNSIKEREVAKKLIEKMIQKKADMMYAKRKKIPKGRQMQKKKSRFKEISKSKNYSKQPFLSKIIPDLLPLLEPEN